MSLFWAFIILCAMGVGVYFVRGATKIDPTFKWIIIAFLVVTGVIFALQVAGVWHEIVNFKLGG